MFSSIKSQLRYKRSLYVSFSPSYTTCRLIHDRATHISNVSLLQENNTMLWRTETGHMSIVHILFTLLELSDHDDL